MSYREITLMTVLFMVLSFFPAYPAAADGSENIVIETERETSLAELIESRGYTLENDGAEEFFREFVALNEAVGDIGRIPKGTTVVLPVEHLVKPEKASGAQIAAQDATSVDRPLSGGDGQAAQGFAENIRIEVEKEASLEELIESRGYTLEDARAEEFFREFVVLNEGIGDIGRIPQGTTVILPPRHLAKKGMVGESPLSVKEPPAGHKGPGGVVAASGLPDKPICDSPGTRKEVVTFTDRETADKFAEDSAKLGYNLYVCSSRTDDGRVLYRVLLAEDSPGISAEDRPAGTLEAGIAQQMSEATKQEEGTVSGDIFEKKSKFYHPFISITAFYSDNIANSSIDKRSDYYAVISPGIWLEAPGGNTGPTLFDSSTSFPSGDIVEMFEDEVFRRFNATVFYEADIELYSKYSSENMTGHRAEGDIKYRFRGGLSVGLHDQYLYSHDVRETSASDELNKFQSNLFNVYAAYNTAKNTSIRLSYTNFLVDYTEPRNDFRDRVDNALSGAFFYRTGSRTSLFAEYELVDIRYDINSGSDSKEQHYWLGINWNVAAKTRGIFKAGYGIKSFDSPGGSVNEIILEGNIEHSLTPKTALNLKAWRKTNESDISDYRYVLTHGLSAGVNHRITSRISGYADLMYSKEYYKDRIQGGPDERGRTDNYYSIGLGGRYAFKRWLSSEAGYIYFKRNSNFPGFDYTSNVFYLKCNLSL